jgi:1-acyl-sn-glycerol-3-phosphate acyltransferase
MPPKRDPSRPQVTDLCKHPGCGKRRLGSSELCPEHLNQKLDAERSAREKARTEGAGNWAGWDLPPAAPKGLIDRVLSAAAGTGAGAKASPEGGEPGKTETLAEIRAEVARKIEGELDKLGLGPLLGGVAPRDAVERFARSSGWLTPEQEVEAWRVVRALVDRGITDVERWRAALTAARAAAETGRPAAAPAAAPGEAPAPGREEPRRAIEAEIGRAAGAGLGRAARVLYRRAAEGAAILGKALERAAAIEGGPLDRRGLAAALGILERGAAGLGRAVRRGALDAAARSLMGGPAGAVSELVDAASRAAEAIEGGLALARRRLEGRYETDAYGRDEDVARAARPVLRFFYRRWFRVEASGAEGIPARGPALIVANHAGPHPFDAAMIATAVEEAAGAARPARMLVFEWLASLPFLASLLEKTGMVVSHPANCERLLADGHVVGLFPEGARGAGREAAVPERPLDFAGAEFVRIALRARAPIIPCAVRVAAGRAVAALPGPLAALMGRVPVPSRWSIRFGRPIRPEDLGGPEKAQDDAAVAAAAARVKSAIEEMLALPT